MAIGFIGCQGSNETVVCPPSTELDGQGPPIGRRVVCVDRSKTTGTRRAFRQGPEVRWFAGGALRSKQTFVDDQLQGESVSWFANGKMSKKGHYQKGHKTGVWSEWGTDGALQSETTYSQGLMDGPRRFFYADGQLKSEHHYRIGIIHGPAKGFYPDGALQYSGRYGDNVRQGVWLRYDQRGDLLKAERFVDGKPKLRSTADKP